MVDVVVLVSIAQAFATVVVGLIVWSVKRELYKLDSTVSILSQLRIDFAIAQTKLDNHMREDSDRFRNIDQRFREHFEMLTLENRQGGANGGG